MKKRLLSSLSFLVVLGGGRAAAAPCVPSGTAGAEYASCREQVEARRLAAEATLREARSVPDKQAQAMQREAAQVLLDVWSDGFSAACRAGDGRWCDHSAEILYQASHAFRWGGDKARAREVRAMLLDPNNGLEKSPIAARALYDSAVDATTLLDFERAANAYEAFAAKLPKDDSASDALENAFVFRVALGQLDAAEKALDALERIHGSRSLLALDFLGFALADAMARAADWPRVEAFLVSRERLFKKSPDELRLRVDALRAQSLAKQRKTAQAEALYKRVASVPVDVLLANVTNGPGGERSIGRALEAIGDATLFRAEQLASEYLNLTIKRGDKASLTRKEEALARAENAYRAVLELQPVPPPRQTVVAVAKVARMYGQLWAQAHLVLGEQPAAPFFLRAKAKHKSCVDLAAKLQVRDSGAEACSAWLTVHVPSEHPAMHELLPAFRANGVDRRPPPALDEDGSVISKPVAPQQLPLPPA